MTTHEQESQAPARIEIERPGGISLKQLYVEDAQAYFDLLEYNRDYFRQKHEGGTDETAEKYPDVETLILSITHPDNPDRLRFGVWHGDTMVGSINLTPEENKIAEVGYWTGEQYAGNGFATEAVRLLSEYAFTQFDLEKLFAKVFVGNDYSKKVLLKSGFIWEKFVREEDPKTGEIKLLNQLQLKTPQDTILNKLSISA